MTGIDGKEYQHDTWYPLPFIFEGKAMLPVPFHSVESFYLFVRCGTGVWHWNPWTSLRGATDWCVRLEGWYEI